MRFYILLATCVSAVICSPTGDYCKAPFQRIGNGCYLISTEKVTGDAAAHVLCADRGAYLANFETLEEAMRMKYELLVRKTGLIYYIGGRKMNRNIAGGDWKWFKHGETSNIKYFLFPKSQPNGSSQDPQDCLSFWAPEENNWNRTAMIFIVFFASFLLTVKGAPTADPCGFPYRRIGEGCYLIVNDTVSADTAIVKTKIDQSFPDAQFRVDNYHFWRKDRNAHGGRIVMYIRSDLPCDRKQNMECEIIESIAAELVVNGKKWLISGMYRPQTISDNDFINDFTKTHDKISVKYDNMIFLGDLNYNLLSIDKCTPLSTVCDICGIENIVKGATCFTKDAKPTLNDVILTNKKNMLQNTTNFNCGLSDVHNIIAVQLKSDVPSIKKPLKKYRSYKQLDEEKFLHDLEQANLTTIVDNVENVNEAYDIFLTPN
ncbi:Hypothetical predicted protein [Mytilus galloprovincialis]|uniref:C-type lectin domain-containing protein n=1 Tax=Mytilus galloprovincialis TaxID=29158 RepID=A0A8B6CV91_MYTGA|nr:Hypothetical predicted protein [Mytilus galloprovincialis]